METPLSSIHVSIQGLSKTKLSTLEPYMDKIKNSIQLKDLIVNTQLACNDLRELDIFKEISIHLDTHDEYDIHVRLQVVESPTISGKIGTFFGNDDQSFVNISFINYLNSFMNSIELFFKNKESFWTCRDSRCQLFVWN